MKKGRNHDSRPRTAGPRVADARPHGTRWGLALLAAGIALALSGAAEAGGVLRWGAAMNTIAQDAVYAGVGGMIIGAVMCGVAVATAAQAVLYQGMGLCAGGAIALGGSALITSLFGAGAGGGPVSLTDYARATAVPAPALVASPRPAGG